MANPGEIKKKSESGELESPKLDKYLNAINRDHSNFTKFEQRLVAAQKTRKKK